MKVVYSIIAVLFFSFSQVIAQTDGLGVDVADPQEKLDVNGAVRIGNTTNTNAGTIRWTGTDFEGYNGTEWVSLSTPASADAWSATNTGGVNSQTWTTIPGMSVTFTLTDSAEVHMNANGSLRINSGYNFCHQSFRFVIDGSAQGDANYGQLIEGGEANNIVWHGWKFGYSTQLAPGSHTILVQTRDSKTPASSGPQCRVCQEIAGQTEGYNLGSLRVQAFYK